MTGQAARAGSVATRAGDGSAWTRASLREYLCATTIAAWQDQKHLPLHWPLSQWCALRAVEPPRPIPNRVVKRGSAEGTGGMPAGRVGPCTIPVLSEKG